MNQQHSRRAALLCVAGVLGFGLTLLYVPLQPGQYRAVPAERGARGTQDEPLDYEPLTLIDWQPTFAPNYDWIWNRQTIPSEEFPFFEDRIYWPWVAVEQLLLVLLVGGLVAHTIYIGRRRGARADPMP